MEDLGNMPLTSSWSIRMVGCLLNPNGGTESHPMANIRIAGRVRASVADPGFRKGGGTEMT